MNKDDLARRLRKLPEDAVLFHLDYYRDPDGKTFTVAESFALLRANSRLPIYVNTDNKIGFGAVGGIVARMATRILAGEAAEAIPLMRTAPSRPVFDYEILQQYHIPLRLLPADSKLIHQPASFYVLYKKYIWLAVLLMAVQSVMIFFLLRNIRQRKKAEKGLLESEHFIAALFDNISEAVVSCDALGKLALFNQAARNLHGLPELPIPADEWAEYYDLYEADGRTSLDKERIPLYRAYTGETVRNAEMVVKPKKGNPVRLIANAVPLVDEQGKIAGAVASMHDITAQVRAETALQSNLDRMGQIFASLNEAVLLVDMETGMIHECNPAAEEMFGYKRQELLGAATESLHVDQRAFSRFEATVRSQLRGADHFTFEYRMKRKNGEVFPTEHFGRSIMQEGTVHTRVSVIRDISRRRQDEAEIVKHRRHLEELVGKRTAELQEKLSEIERMNRLFVDRELAMAELKKKIRRLEKQ